MNPSIEEGKNAFLKVYSAEIRRDHPSWTFARSFAEAQRLHPELAEEFDEQPTSQPAYQAPLPGQVGADQAKLDELLSRFMPKKVQARKPAPEIDKRDCVLVYASTGELVDIELR